MESRIAKPKLVVIVGPTASGKSELAMKIATKFDGEIIAADSRTIYKGLNIGTAKPSYQDRKKIPHWGLDLLEPGQKYSAKEFKDYAEAKIKDIKLRGKLPILVGGTGLYVDSLLFDFNFRPTNSRERTKLENLSLEALQRIIVQKGYKMPENSQNKRHLLRVIESMGQNSDRLAKPLKEATIVGLLPSDLIMREKINQRIGQNLNLLLGEVRRLLKIYSKEAVESGGISYKFCVLYLEGRLSKPDLQQKIQTKEWQYARRQKTWFKRNSYIEWFDSVKVAEKYLDAVLNT